MNKLFWILACYLCCFCISSALCQTDANGSASETLYHQQQSNSIAYYVISGGGIMAATNVNFHHYATLAQPVAGESKNVKHGLISGFWNPTLALMVEVKEKEQPDLPGSFVLHQNYPNPFNPQTTIAFELPQRCQVTLEIFNVVGRCMRTIGPHIHEPGHVQLSWDGCDNQGRAVSTGIYFYRLCAITKENETLFQQTKKMLFVK